MSKETTTYNLLISCPNDVQEEVKKVYEKVDVFNRTIGNNLNIRIDSKHWKRDSYPQSGGSPQDLLNKQLVANCDFAVAIFRNRFGTPTDDYDSGTEEEIELLLNDGKQVFLYFYKPINDIESIKGEQYNKVIEYRKEYESSRKGIAHEYTDIENFGDKFFNHLTMYCYQKITSDINANKVTKNVEPKLVIKEAKENHNDNVTILRNKIMESKFINDKLDGIKDLFAQITNIDLPKKISEGNKVNTDVSSDNKNSGIYKAVSNFTVAASSLATALMGEKVETLDIMTKETIERYAYHQDIEIDESFFYLGCLERRKSSNFDGKFYLEKVNSITVYGNEEEKKKYNLIVELSKKIREFLAYEKYFISLDRLFYIELMLCNLGERYDEDIDIVIRINRGSICNATEVPVPDQTIVDENNRYHFSLGFLKLADKIFAENYDSSKENQQDNDLAEDVLESVRRVFYNDYKKYIQKDIQKLFSFYKWYKDEHDDILKLKIHYLKHGMNMLFPTKLYFKEIPKYIKYEIKSKYQVSPTIGELVINSNVNSD
ncbi:MAG: hypothetical protein JXN65_02055 [Clostridia bacterium]|nr:hypothetical protein [Clostridia bacterium]